MFRERGFIFGVLILFSLGIICGAAVENSLHLTIQTTNSSGITTGTFAFVFNISSSSDCANVVYSNSTTLTTDSRGIISYYLENVVLDFSTQYWLCYYRNGTLINATKLAKTPYSFTASNISTTGGLNIAGNLNITGELYVNGTSYSSNYLPTIVASGNNSNGYYVKYIDGTMMQWGTIATNLSAGSSSLILPTPFINSNYQAVGNLNTGTVAAYASVVYLPYVGTNTTNLNFYITSTNGASASINLSWSAVGKWSNTPYNTSTITVGGGIPAGAIVAYNRTSCPVGWTLADGSSGTPDLRGIFIRGSGTNSILKYANGSYFSSVLGSYRNDSFQGHWHYPDENTGIKILANAVSAGSGLHGLSGSGTIYTGPPVTDGTNGAPRTGAETSPAYYSTIYCVKTTEDTATSNSIWATSGNNVLLNNASMKLNLPTISSNLTLASNTPHLKFQIPFVEGPSTAGKITFTNQDYGGAYYPSGMAGIRADLYSQENDNGALIFSAMSVGTLYDVMTINGQGATIHQSLTVTGQGSTINQSAWIAPTLQNSWVNYGTWSPAGYMKDSMGFVHLRGLIKSGTVDTCAFTLPAGYRPEYQGLYGIISNGVIGRVDILTSGCVQINSPSSNTWASLEGITFRAYA